MPDTLPITPPSPPIVPFDRLNGITVWRCGRFWGSVWKDRLDWRYRVWDGDNEREVAKGAMMTKRAAKSMCHGWLAEAVSKGT